MIRIRQHRQLAQFRKYLLEQIDSFCGEIERKERAAREIAARPREALDEAELDWIAADGKQDGNVRGRPHRANCGAARHGEVHVAARQFGYHRAQRIGIARRIAKLEHNVFSLDVAALAQSFAKSIHERVRLRFRRNPKDATELGLLLRSCRDRATRGPRRQAE